MWRNSGRTVTVKFLGDALVMFPVLIWLFFPNWYTFLLVVFLIVIIRITQYKGMSVFHFLLYLRSSLAGKIKPNRSNMYKRMMITKKAANSK